MREFTHLVVAVSLFGALSVGCFSGRSDDNTAARDPDGTGAIELSLAATSVAADRVTVELRLDTDGGVPSKARVMELTLQMDESLSLAGYSAGDALEAAGKTLVVQERAGDGLRLVAYSGDSLGTLAPGVVAVLELDRASALPATIDFDTGRQMFAPMEANTGLHVGEPLTVGAR